LIFYITICGLVGRFLLVLNALTFKTLKDRQKRRPFECGFEPTGLTRLPFCIKFLLVAVIFLVFDIEIALILPIIFSTFIIITFIGVITLGAFFEWR
jgi:NADH-ubiquinone oxidoreductase chain 3